MHIDKYFTHYYSPCVLLSFSLSPAEEILHANNAIWMSSNAKQLLYASFNDSHVQEQHFAWYGTTSGGAAGGAATSGSGTSGGNGAGPGNTGGTAGGTNPHANLYPEIRSLR